MPTEPAHPWRLNTNERFRDVVRIFMNFSTASLLLPVFFAREFLGLPDETPLHTVITPIVYVSWSFFGLSILLGIAFYYFSAKWIRLAWEQTADVLCIQMTDKGVDRALDWTFWLSILAYAVGLILLIVFFVGYSPPSSQ